MRVRVRVARSEPPRAFGFGLRFGFGFGLRFGVRSGLRSGLRFGFGFGSAHAGEERVPVRGLGLGLG